MKEQAPSIVRILAVDDEQIILDEFLEVLCPRQDLPDVTRNFEDLYAKLFPTASPSSFVSSFELVLCRQGNEAVEKVRAAIEENRPFAVAFVDVRMPPGPDGVWTAERIRAIDPHVQIVMVTAYSDVDPATISRRVTPTDKLLYLQKPFHPHEIRQFACALGLKWFAEKQLQKKAVELTESNEELKREIAEHKRTEEKRQLLSRAIMSTEDCVYITDTQGKIIFVNRAFCETYQYREQEVVGKDADFLWASKVPDADSENGFLANDGWEVAFFHRRKAGDEFPVFISKSDVRDERGKQVALVVIARDISERMHTENRLRTELLDSKNKLRLTQETLSTASEAMLESLTILKDIIRSAKVDVCGKNCPQLEEDLEPAENLIERAIKTACDLHDTFQVEADKMEIVVDQF
ncbi:MAG: PAS domain-containing protein [Planctomycetota bacterium]|jgi:PAS domain S-box-containing protein